MPVAPDRRLRTNKPLIGNGLLLTHSKEVNDANETVTQANYLYTIRAVAAAVTLTLPLAPADGEEHCFQRVAGNQNIVIDGSSLGTGKPINDAATWTLGAQELSVSIRFDATADQWLVRSL